MRLAAALATSIGLCLALIGWLDAAIFSSAAGRVVGLAGTVMLVAGALSSATLFRSGRMTASTLLIVFLGTLPFAGFGGFLWWQIQLSKERSAACEAGDADACLAFGVRKVRRGERDAAMPRLRRACELGKAEGCFMAGGIAPRATGVEWLARACNLSDARGCAKAAQLLRTGDGVTSDASRACMLAARGCASGHAPSCAEAAYCAAPNSDGSAAPAAP